MKIIFVNSEQYYDLWNKLIPAQRDSGGLPHPAIVLRHLNALVLLRDGVELGSVEAMNPEHFSIAWFTETVINKKYFEVG
jgi:hypothetical protein